MTEFSRDEVETAFRHYFLTGPVLEDWIAWSRLFTDDAVYFDHFYGRFRGPAEIQLFLDPRLFLGHSREIANVPFSFDEPPATPPATAHAPSGEASIFEAIGVSTRCSEPVPSVCIRMR